jgi:pyruvate dehydrogenase E1 component
MLGPQPWPVVAASDYVKALPQRLAPWCPAGLTALGTDGFGRSEGRENLRRFFEVSAEHIALAALTELSRQGKFDATRLGSALRELGIDPDVPDPAVS